MGKEVLGGADGKARCPCGRLRYPRYPICPKCYCQGTQSLKAWACVSSQLRFLQRRHRLISAPQRDHKQPACPKATLLRIKADCKIG